MVRHVRGREWSLAGSVGVGGTLFSFSFTIEYCLAFNVPVPSSLAYCCFVMHCLLAVILLNMIRAFLQICNEEPLHHQLAVSVDAPCQPTTVQDKPGEEVIHTPPALMDLVVPPPEGYPPLPRWKVSNCKANLSLSCVRLLIFSSQFFSL